MNTFLRKLNWVDGRTEFPLWKEEGDILVTPDLDRWHIERTPTVSDLVHVGDTVYTSYDTGGIVINIHPYSICCCPYRGQSTTKLCKAAWDAPAQTDRYHRELITWSIVYVEPDSKQFKNGNFQECDLCFLNELVCVKGRILQLFEENTDEIFVKSGSSTFKLQLPLFG